MDIIISSASKRRTCRGITNLYLVEQLYTQYAVSDQRHVDDDGECIQEREYVLKSERIAGVAFADYAVVDGSDEYKGNRPQHVTNAAGMTSKSDTI